MAKKIILWLTALVVLGVLAIALYNFYYFYKGVDVPTYVPPAAVPDNTVAAGPVTAISAGSISITKQDGSTATFAIVAATEVLITAEGKPGTPIAASSIRPGALVLITPSADAATAQTIVLLP